MEKGREKVENRRRAAKKFLGKGPQTPFMVEQRRIFARFLERRPITPSVSVITRAHQCWNEHRTDWENAAEKGNGYYDYKTLARTI